MTTAKLYQKHRAGEIGRDRFLYEVRRDTNLPWITNMTSYEDAVKILKNKGVIRESLDPNFPFPMTSASLDLDQLQNLNNLQEGFTQALMQKGQGSQEYPGMEYRTAGKKGGPKDPILSDILSHYQVRDNYEEAIELAAAENGMDPDELMQKYPADAIESELHMYSDMADVKENLNEVDNNIQMVPEVDLVNPYFLKRGMQVELSKIKQLTDDSYVIAMNKAAKKLRKNPHAYDDVMLFNAKQIEKRDAKLEMNVVKKDNHVDKDNEMKKVKGFEAKKNTTTPKNENKKGKPKGVKTMKEDNKEKVLHEIANFLKKKDNLSENGGPVSGLVPQERSDYHRDEEVMTPEGMGKVISRQGSIVELEMEDGNTKHFTLNVLDKSKEDHQQKQIDADKEERDRMWSNWDQKQKTGENPYAKTFGGEIAYEPEDIQTLLKKLKEIAQKLKTKKEGSIVMTRTGTAVAGTKNPADAFKKALDLRQQTGDQFDVLDTRTGQKKKV